MSPTKSRRKAFAAEKVLHLKSRCAKKYFFSIPILINFESGARSGQPWGLAVMDLWELKLSSPALKLYRSMHNQRIRAILNLVDRTRRKIYAGKTVFYSTMELLPPRI